MARIRTIKPEFPQSESMGRVSRDARLLFVELWTICDDSGRTRAASRMLASLLFPYDDDAPELMDGWLSELQREGCIELYAIGGNTYLQISKWLEHQKIDKPSKSKIPEFAESSRIVAKARECSSEDLDLDLDLDLDQGPRTKDHSLDRSSDKTSEGRESDFFDHQVVPSKPPVPIDDFEEWWKRYPRKTAKGHARAAYAKARRKASAQQLLAGLQRALPKLNAAEERYRPHPATWLNGERWTDEAGSARGSPTGGSAMADVDVWRARLKEFEEFGGRTWIAMWGPPPGQDGCRVPEELLGDRFQRRAA